MGSRQEWSGNAALMLVLYQTGDGRQRPMFPRCRARGFHLIVLDMMPKHMPVSQMWTWLRCFERSGHAKPQRSSL